MKLQRCLFLVYLAVFLPVYCNAQKLSPGMVELGVKLDKTFDRHLRTWTRERIVPVYPGENVLIESWKASDRRVKIAVVPYPSNEAASKALSDFTRHQSTKATVSSIGAEAWIWGYSNDIAFRRGSLNVFIGSVVELTLLSVENFELQSLNKAEQVATNKLIACFVDLVILGEFERRRFHDASSNCLHDLMRKGFINVDDCTRRF